VRRPAEPLIVLLGFTDPRSGEAVFSRRAARARPGPLDAAPLSGTRGAEGLPSSPRERDSR